MTAVWTLLSAGLVIVALSVIFQQPFRTSGRGSLARLEMRSTWRALRRFAGRRPEALAGPLVLVSSIGTWSLLPVTGRALVLMPNLPEKFALQTQLNPRALEGFVGTLYPRCSPSMRWSASPS